MVSDILAGDGKLANLFYSVIYAIQFFTTLQASLDPTCMLRRRASLMSSRKAHRDEQIDFFLPHMNTNDNRYIFQIEGNPGSFRLSTDKVPQRLMTHASDT